MSWNYRVMRYRVAGEQAAPHTHGIHEVYYGDDGAVRNWTQRPVSLTGFDPDDLRWRVEEILKAFNESVLDYGDDEPPPNVEPGVTL